MTNFALTPTTGPLTMTSREIAALVEKRHDHVIRDIRNMLAQLYGDTDVEKAAKITVGQRWRELRKWCAANDVTPKQVPDRRYGEVKAWPAAAWLAVFEIDLRTMFAPEKQAA